MEIIPLSEGAFTVDASKKFVPFDVQKDELSDRNHGSLLVEIQPFVVITQNEIILLDTGLGNIEENGRLQLCNNLNAHGINANDVTKVLMSHLHKDHAGALLNPYTKEVTFENATYHIQQQELEYALAKGAPSYDNDMLETLLSSGNIVFEKELIGNIGNNIRYEVTEAHSKYHRVVWINEDGKIGFFGGDDAPQLSQMKRRFAAKYDFDGKKAMLLRDRWMEDGKTNRWNFLFYHDVKTPTYTFADM